MDLDLISVDMFQTLVDVNTIREKAWQIFLGERYSVDTAQKGWDFTAQRILGFFSGEAVENDGFETVKSVFARVHAKAFQQFDIDFDHRKAASILARLHNDALPYPDTESFLDFIAGRYTVVISSDADRDMVSGLPYLKRSDSIFISEALGCYKMDRRNRFYLSVLNRCRVEPDRILHIGDSVADVVNPKRLGMKTCWINRTGSSWNHATEPDYIFPDLKSLMQVL